MEFLPLLDALFETAPVGLAVLDRDLRFVRINTALKAVGGRNAVEAVGRTLREALPALAPALEPICRSVIETGEPHRDVEVSGASEASGKVRQHWLASCHLVPGAGGSAVGVGIVLVDITDHRRAIEDFAAQRTFLRQVIDLDPNFVFAKDREGRFTLVNKAVADAYGTTVDDLIGKTDADFNPNAEEVEHFRRDDLEVMDTKRDKLVAEEAITDAAGRVRYLQTIKRAIVSPDGRADQVLGVSNDITARKKLEEQLPQAQKMEAIGRLAGGVAHDFNNLLTVILGSVDLMLAELGPGHPMRPSAEEIRQAAERAAMLTQQLLAFSRKQVLQPRVLDLNRVVTESAEMLRRLIGENVELRTVFDPQLGSVRADPGQMTQVILNLVINARDAMPQGGTLKIETANASLDPADAAAKPEAAAGEYVVITVSDTGHGIAPHVMPRIFEPFFTTKETGQGTGLGLATSYGIVRQSGGHIRVFSEPGRGTTFRVYLPRVEDSAERTERSMAPAARRGSETILLVEDEALVRGVAARSLRQLGYVILEASNGVEALRVASGHPGAIHLLVTDVVMPQMGGIELAARLTRARPGTRVLYTSGYTEHSMELADVSGKGIAFVPKPYLPESLARRIREALDTPTA